MAALIKNAISVTVRDTAKRTKLWYHIQMVIRASFVFPDSTSMPGEYMGKQLAAKPRHWLNPKSVCTYFLTMQHLPTKLFEEHSVNRAEG